MPTHLERLFTDETLLKGSWSPTTGVVVEMSVLPPTWNRALDRIGRDLSVRQFGGTIAEIRFEAVRQVYRDVDDEDYVWLASAVTPAGVENHVSGMGYGGGGVLPDADEEAIAESCAYLLQDQIANAGIVWPRGRAGGFVYPGLVDGVATWVDRGVDEYSPIGSLPT